MGGMKITFITDRVLMLGNNDFQAGKITVPANTTIPAGTVLTRDDTDKKLFIPAEDGDDFLALVPFDIENTAAAAKTMGFRACISGRVRADMVTVEGVTATVDQCDLLRKVGFIPAKVTDISHLDNH